MELLSPAGNLESALAALKAGADALYLGGKAFSARMNADNFDDKELKEIVSIAHSIGKKVYVTLNTMLFQDEFMEAYRFAKYCHQIDVDGLIIQDLGIAYYLHQRLPKLALHASTQINCHNIEQAKALKKLGFVRIVLAREAPLSLAKQIKELGLEVELFVHGALCVCYSGNCLMSSFIGGRSGNRGRCAQPCRMAYKLIEDGKAISEESYLISPKDLMTLDHIQELVEAGIDSLKIEGRLKGTSYIYQTSLSYRHALDACLAKKIDENLKEDENKLQRIYSRGFSKGYLFDESIFNLLNQKSSSHQGERIGKVVRAKGSRLTIRLEKMLHRLDGIRFNGKEQFGLSVEKMFLNGNPVEMANPGENIDLAMIENAENYFGNEVIKTSDYLLNKEIENKLKEKLKVNIQAKGVFKLGKPMELSLSYLGKNIQVQGNLPEASLKGGTSIERIKEQLAKSGEFPYVIVNPELDYEPCFINLGELNALRRKAFEALYQSLVHENEINELDYHPEANKAAENTTLFAISENSNIEDDLLNYGILTYSKNGESFRIGERVDQRPRFPMGNYISHYAILRADSLSRLIASSYCNIANSYALDAYYALGFDEAMLSNEIDVNSIKELIDDYQTRHDNLPSISLLGYGRIEMMVMKSCPIGTYFHNKKDHCNLCHTHRYELEDRMGYRYPIEGDRFCHIHIEQNKPIYLLDRLLELPLTSIYLQFEDEKDDLIHKIIDSYKTKQVPEQLDYQIGHFLKRSL